MHAEYELLLLLALALAMLTDPRRPKVATLSKVLMTFTQLL